MELKQYFDDNSQIELANAIGFAPSFVNQWVKKRRPVPIAACVAIEQFTKGAVTRKELRPKDWQAIWPDLSKQPRKPRTTPSTTEASHV